MQIKQLTEPFVAVQQEDNGKFAIAIGNNLLTKFVYTEEQAEKAVKKIAEPLLINFIGFMVENMMVAVQKNQKTETTNNMEELKDE